MEGKSDLLQGRDEICKFLGISVVTFPKFISWGMPARFHQGRWYAHKKPVETWLEKWTNVCSSKLSTKEEEEL